MNFKKTNHFWTRAWERGIQQNQINILLQSVDLLSGKSILVFGKEKILEAGIKIDNKSHLAIIAKGDLLLTVFVVPDLFYYMKSNINTNLKII